MTSRISGQTSTFDFVLSPSWENKKGKLCPEIPESSNIERGHCGMIILSSLPSLRQVSRKCYNNSSITLQEKGKALFCSVVSVLLHNNAL